MKDECVEQHRYDISQVELLLTWGSRVERAVPTV